MIPEFHGGGDMRHMHQIGEAGGWTGAIAGAAMAVSGTLKLLGSIGPSDIQSWLMVFVGIVGGGLGMGSAIYLRILKAKMDGEQIQAIYADNISQIKAGLPVRYPQFLPAPTIKVEVESRSGTVKTIKLNTPDPDVSIYKGSS
jgi:hypothetical protein